MTIVKESNPIQKAEKELLKFAEKAKKERIAQLAPFFGILKDRDDIDPLKLQKKWRSEW